MESPASDVPERLALIAYRPPCRDAQTGALLVTAKTNCNRTVAVRFSRELATQLVHDFANLLTADPQMRRERVRRIDPDFRNALPTIEWGGGFTPAPAGAPAPKIAALRVLPEQRPLRAGLTPEQIDAAWARFRAGEAPLHLLAQELGCSDIAVRHAFERTHGADFATIRGCYRGGRSGAEVKREIDRLLSGERQPVTKPNGKLL
jgi:hypothetical protein